MHSNPSGQNVPPGTNVNGGLLPSPRGSDTDEGTKFQKIRLPQTHSAFGEPTTNTAYASPDSSPNARLNPSAPQDLEKKQQFVAPVSNPSPVPSEPPKKTAPSEHDYATMVKIASSGVFSILLSIILFAASFVYLKSGDFGTNFTLYVCQTWIIAALYAIYLFVGIFLIWTFFKLGDNFDRAARLRAMKLKIYTIGTIFGISVIFTVLVLAYAPLRINQDDFLVVDSFSFALPIASLLASLVDMFISWYYVYPPCGEQELEKEDKYVILKAVVFLILLPIFCAIFLYVTIRSCCGGKSNSGSSNGQHYREAAGNPENNRLNSET